MKLFIPVAFAAFFAFSLTSCDKREYTCACKMTNGTEKTMLLGRMNNNAAQKQCNQYQQDLTNASLGVVGSCKVVY